MAWRMTTTLTMPHQMKTIAAPEQLQPAGDNVTIGANQSHKPDDTANQSDQPDNAISQSQPPTITIAQLESLNENPNQSQQRTDSTEFSVKINRTHAMDSTLPNN